MLEHAAQDYYLEPTTMLAAMIPGTKHIGLVGSMSTTYRDPYTVARTFASLDHLSGGRASWNIVTTGNPTSAQNFSHDAHPDKGDRYTRAEEFVRIVKGLWDSYEDDAFLRDQKAGRFLDPSKMHVLNHKSENFSVRGPLNVERCPQGYPVMLRRRRLRPRQGARRGNRRCAVHRPARQGAGPGVLSRREGADGQIRPLAGRARRFCRAR